MALAFSLITRLVFALTIFFSSLLFSSVEDYYRITLEPSSTNYGETGLLEIPTARFLQEGTLKMGISASYPYEFTFITASPFSWLEATYRYAEEKNLLYGPAAFSGNQTHKDKGFDLKLRILEESFYLPNVALGLRDIAGTGRFSSEYLSASKKFGNLDFTLGLGWGNLGSDANIRNPFLSLDPRFGNRPPKAAYGGRFNVKDWFSGDRAALFAGIEYSIPRYGLNLKMEYDTSRPDIEGIRKSIDVKSRFNFGLVRPLGDFIDLGLSFERGTEFRFSFVFKTNYSKGLVPKLDPPLNVIPLSREQQRTVAQDPKVLFRSLNRSLRDEKIYIQGASYNEESVDVVISQVRFRSYPRAVGRTARITSALSPESVKEINVFVMNGDIEVSSVSLNRIEFDKAINKEGSISEVLYRSQINPSGYQAKYLSTDFKPLIRYPEFFWSFLTYWTVVYCMEYKVDPDCDIWKGDELWFGFWTYSYSLSSSS